MSPVKRKGNPKISPEQFIYIWQTSESVDEVQQKTGLTVEVIYSRSTSYRREGVPLKKFQRRSAKTNKRNWGALASYAESLNTD